MSYKILILLAILLKTDVFVYAQDWQYRVMKNDDQAAQVSAMSMTPDGTAKTTLLILNNCNFKNTFELQYIVYNIEKVKNFNLEDFNGPNSPASKRKLMTIKIGSQSQNFIMRIPVGGYRTMDGGFLFNKLEHYKKGDVYRLANMLLKHPSSITVSVSSYSDKNKIIQTTFPATGASSAIAKAFECEKTHKRN